MNSIQQKIERLVYMCFSLRPKVKEVILQNVELLNQKQLLALLDKLEKLKKHEEEQIANLSPEKAERIFNDIQEALKEEREKEEQKEGACDEEKERQLLSQL